MQWKVNEISEILWDNYGVSLVVLVGISDIVFVNKLKHKTVSTLYKSFCPCLLMHTTCIASSTD